MSEIARDFLLLNEIFEKKIVLIGPSSTTGLFHGVLWMYVNFPAYLVGNGDPVIVGWFWVLLVVGFVASCFYIGKELFGQKTAYLYALMSSIYGVFHVRGLYNPDGAMFVIPWFFFFFIKYLKTHKARYLIAHVVAAGAIIQFQMAIGIPFFILSIVYGSYYALKHGKRLHVAVYSIIILTVSNFIIFDLRHGFLLAKIVFRFATSATRDHPNIISMLDQRVRLMTTGVEIFRVDPGGRNFIMFLVCVFFLIFQIKDKKNRQIYLTFLYFYLGFFVLSNLNSGGLLYFYIYPLFPFVFLIFSSFITSRYSKLFVLIFFIVYAFNVHSAISDSYIAFVSAFGKSDISWLSYKNLAKSVFTTKDKEFGYFVYSPDVIGYRPKYALLYTQRHYPQKKAHYFKKMPVTYLVIAPPAPDRPFMKDEWWRVNLLHINKSPDSTIKFSDGYKIEKYLLTEEEVKIPTEENIDPGLHFR